MMEHAATVDAETSLAGAVHLLLHLAVAYVGPKHMIALVTPVGCGVILDAQCKQRPSISRHVAFTTHKLADFVCHVYFIWLWSARVSTGSPCSLWWLLIVVAHAASAVSHGARYTMGPIAAYENIIVYGFKLEYCVDCIAHTISAVQLLGGSCCIACLTLVWCGPQSLCTHLTARHCQHARPARRMPKAASPIDAGC